MPTMERQQLEGERDRAREEKRELEGERGEGGPKTSSSKSQ